MDASPIERLRIEREKSITLLKENGYWSEDSTLVTTSNTAEQILSTSLDLLEELKWSSLMALSDDEQAEALPRALAEYALMSLESVPAAEAGPSVAGPSVAEALADFALMAMESYCPWPRLDRPLPKPWLIPPSMRWVICRWARSAVGV